MGENIFGIHDTSHLQLFQSKVNKIRLSLQN